MRSKMEGGEVDREEQVMTKIERNSIQNSQDHVMGDVYLLASTHIAQ